MPDWRDACVTQINTEKTSSCHWPGFWWSQESNRFPFLHVSPHTSGVRGNDGCLLVPKSVLAGHLSVARTEAADAIRQGCWEAGGLSGSSEPVPQQLGPIWVPRSGTGDIRRAKFSFALLRYEQPRL
jgi:hypothetical protein